MVNTHVPTSELPSLTHVLHIAAPEHASRPGTVSSGMVQTFQSPTGVLQRASTHSTDHNHRTGSPPPAGRASQLSFSPTSHEHFVPTDEKSPTAWYSPESVESAEDAPPSATPRSSTFLVPRGPGAISPVSDTNGTSSFSPVFPASAGAHPSPSRDAAPPPASSPADSPAGAPALRPLSPLPPPPASPYAWDRPPPSSEYLPGSAGPASRRSTFRASVPPVPSPPYAHGEAHFSFALAVAAQGAGGGAEDGGSERSALPAYSRY